MRRRGPIRERPFRLRQSHVHPRHLSHLWTTAAFRPRYGAGPSLFRVRLPPSRPGDCRQQAGPPALRGTAAARGGNVGGGVLQAGIQLVTAVALLAAGVLALIGRDGYRAWRRWLNPPPRRDRR